MNLKRLLAVLTLLLGLPIVADDFWCKRYDITEDKFQRIDAKVGSATVQDVKLELPVQKGPLKGRNQAVVTIKNYGEKGLRFHVAIALFDEKGNLVGCGTTGSKIGSTKGGEEESFFVTFDYVSARLSKAKLFYITLESMPLD